MDVKHDLFVPIFQRRVVFTKFDIYDILQMYMLMLHDELHARLTSNLALGSSQTVIFDHEITNVGHAYNSGTGHFTAPYDGIYYCSSTFLKAGGAVPLHLQMVRNKGNNKITELRTILQRESQNS